MALQIKDDYNFRFGIRLYLIRSSVNVSQEVFADLLDVNYTRYQGIETGHITNDFSLFIWIVDRIHVYFGVNVIDLISKTVDEINLRETVRSSVERFQSLSQMKTQLAGSLLQRDMYQPITWEQRQHLIAEKKLKVRKDAKKKDGPEKDDPRLLVNVLLGDRLKFIRQSIHRNQVHLATSLCISEDRISSLESGQTMRNFSILIRLLLILNRLDVTLYDLILPEIDRAEVLERITEARRRNRSLYVIHNNSVVIEIE